MSPVEEATAGAAKDAPALLREVRLGETPVTLLGTAHVSRSSAQQVADELDTKAYRAVAIELCPSRFDALSNPDRLAQLDLMQVLREGKASMVMANLAMAAYQQRLGEQLGIEPAPLWSLVLPALPRVVGASEWARVRVPGLEGQLRRAGARYWAWVVDMSLRGKPARFARPDHLAGAR
jgi:hypothetical protein